MSISKSVFFALVSSFLLILVAGSAFSGFQSWIEVQSHSQKTTNNHNVTVSGIRLISSVSTTSVPVIQSDVESVKKSSDATALPSAETQSQYLREPVTSHILNRPVGSQSEETQHNLLEPSLVVFSDEIVVEFPQAIANKSQIKQALARLLLSPDPFNEALLSSQSLSFKKNPYFFKKVIDRNGQPIRYPASAFSYIDSLLKSDAYQEIEDSDGQFVVVHIPLVSPNYPKPIERYKEWVDSYSEEFSVSPALVFAIMETESAFNPEAVSRSKAMGLMQLKASAAGKDVFQYVDFKQGQPSHKQLFDEQENIRMGTAYLGLLNHDYFSKVRNDRNKEMLAIASYNGGLSTVLKLFGDSNHKALEQINRLHPRQVYRKLRFEHQSKETREYLDKVLKAKTKYQNILNT
ncbi:MAG: murein transglycosylase domain-containing protein [Pseudomonadota bacterium]|nr:murein transglycosylase domain-containing protein [Pseudomonadota bacterium]